MKKQEADAENEGRDDRLFAVLFYSGDPELARIGEQLSDAQKLDELLSAGWKVTLGRNETPFGQAVSQEMLRLVLLDPWGLRNTTLTDLNHAWVIQRKRARAAQMKTPKQCYLEEVRSTWTEDVAEYLQGFLEGTKLAQQVADMETGEILIPAGRRITSMLCRKTAGHIRNVDPAAFDPFDAQVIHLKTALVAAEKEANIKMAHTHRIWLSGGLKARTG